MTIRVAHSGQTEAPMNQSEKPLTREQVQYRRNWWQAKLDEAKAPLAEQVAFWRSEVKICDLALRVLSEKTPEGEKK